MAVPVLHEVAPQQGPSSGGDLVRIRGEHFASRVEVRFADVLAEVVSLREEGGSSFVDVRSPPHREGVVTLAVHNLDDAGLRIPGERAELVDAYVYRRAQLHLEASLTRIVRTLLRQLKQQLIENTNISVSVDYDANPGDEVHVVTLAELPGVVLSGPTMRENREYSINVLHEAVVDTPGGPELERRRPPFTVDLAFALTAASQRSAELFNMMAAVATFFSRNRWLEMLRNPAKPELGAVRWEMDPDGELRTDLRGSDDVRAFTWGLVIRGFDIDEGLPMERGRAVTETELQRASSLQGES